MKLSILSSSDLQQDSTLSHDSLMASSSLPFKTTKDDIFQIIKIRNKKKWTPEEDSYLIQLASCYQEKHWKIIAEHFKHKNSLQCFSRYKGIKPGVVKGHWTTSEDNEILSLVGQYGKAWAKISGILKTRNGKQIRDRFINVLDPKIAKKKFSDEEDKLLMKLYMLHGAKWAMIAKKFKERTPDIIKNRFHSSIKKLFYGEGPRTCRRQKKTLKRLKMKNELINETIKPRQFEVAKPKQFHQKNVIVPSKIIKQRANESNFEEGNINCNGTNINTNNNVNEAIFNELYCDNENIKFTIGDDDYFNY